MPVLDLSELTTTPSTMLTSSGPSLRSRQAASTVTCLSEFDWMNNSKGQNPCLVASWAVVPCFPNGYIVPPLTSQADRYGGPTPGSKLWECRCNTVHYSLIAACATCQGYPSPDGVANFTQYAITCPPTILKGAVYPKDIPPETAIPAWAYVDLVGDRWDEAAASALAVQDLPESTHSATPSSTTFTSSSTTSASTSPSGMAPSQSDGSSSANSGSGPSKSTVGLAVGGAIGGLAVLGLAGVAVLLYLRHRRDSRRQPTFGGVLVPADNYYGEDYTKATLYDPDDPTTFPPPRGRRARPLGRPVAEIQ
ncbi:hypothetical protein C8Q76DRAFT_726742 [Earliella scabrosa]|nr:hypothetical protein C8Q76DRAFT_726742 [Earliella scabrosa]